MLHDDQLFWGFSKSAIPVDDLDPVSRSQHWKSKAASCIFSVRFCQIMFQPVMWMLHTGRSIRWAIRHRKSKREGAWGSWCYVPMSFGSLHQNTLTVYHLCNRCTCIHVIYLCMQWTCIFLHGSCACFLRITNYRSFILLLSATRKNLPLGGLGQLSYVCVWHDPAKLYTLCMQFPVRIWMKNKTTVISSRLIRERGELVNNQSVYLVWTCQ